MNKVIENQIRGEIKEALAEHSQGLVFGRIHEIAHSSNSAVETISALRKMARDGDIIKKAGAYFLLTNSNNEVANMNQVEKQPKKMTNRDRIIDTCSTPQTRDEVMAKTGINREVLSSELSALVRQGRLKVTGTAKSKHKHKQYVQTGGQLVPTGTTTKKPFKKTNTEKEADPALNSTGVIAFNLYDNYIRSQDAMDEYISSVCDHNILNPLRTQRDAAKQAYVCFCEQHNINPQT